MRKSYSRIFAQFINNLEFNKLPFRVVKVSKEVLLEKLFFIAMVVFDDDSNTIGNFNIEHQE